METKHTLALSGNPREVQPAVYDTLENIFDCAVNWISDDADHPDTPPEDWQDCFEQTRRAVNAHDELVAALRRLLDQWPQNLSRDRHASDAWAGIEQARAALAKAES